MKRVGIDIGGTFTDIVVFDEETGDVTHSKTMSTPRSPEQGFVEAMDLARVSIADLRALIHGTTLVTNLILERKGARIGLITTRGFRDVLEIMRASRPLPYDLGWRKPNPIVPRDLRFEVTERVDADGKIVEELDRDEVAATVDELLRLGVDGIAVCLIHSYVNDAHERAIENIIRAKAATLPLSVSSRICREIREYERTNTTVVNAYAMPRVKAYVAALAERFGDEDRVSYLNSEGGLQSGAETGQRPISLCFSGPAGGVLGGSYIGQLLGRRNLITIDMGGTSLDVALIRDGRFALKNTFEIEWGVPVKVATIDIKTIGAGGGSIVWIDEGGALRVGPQSAGASSGPACYGQGGTDCTVTDANLVLGLINPDGLLGGRLKLDGAAAERAVGRIAERFSVTLSAAAEGIYRVVNASMAAAIRQMTVEKGIDPRDFALVPFGGAGGQHAAALASEVGISEIILPNMPSVFSAFGMVSAPIKISRSRTVMQQLGGPEQMGWREVFAPLESQIRESIETGGFGGDYTFEYSLDLKYTKQAHEINVLIELDWDAAQMSEAFEARHWDAYGTRLGHGILAVTARLTAVSLLPPLKLRSFRANAKLAPKAVRQATIVGVKGKVPVIDRASLHPGVQVKGPALIEEIDTSFYVPPKAVLTVDRYKNLVIVTRPAQRKSEMAKHDPFTMQVIRNYLYATTQEMIETTVRTAYSPTFAEGHDFSCALFDTDGRMVIQSRGIGVHLGSLVGAMQAVVRKFRKPDPGDVFITNDPYLATHQPDVVVARPIFHRTTHLGYAVNIGHWTDIGGMTPGGCAGTSTHVIQDGLIIPLCRLFSKGKLVEATRDFILSNVRLPDDDWGDLMSQIAATATAETRLRALVGRYGVKDVRGGMQDAIAYSQARFRAKMHEIPDGAYCAIDYIEDDGITDRRYPIQVLITKSKDRFLVDFAGSADQAPTPINASITSTRAAVFTGIIALVDPTIPVNDGIFELVEVRAPDKSITNASWPAPVFGCTFEIAKRIPETILRAFAAKIPERVAAASFGSGNNLSARFIDPRTGQESLWYVFYEGGQGATAAGDGNDAVYFWGGTALNQPIEVWEHRYPLLVERYALREDSGGAGRFRGGLGTVREMRLLADHHLSGLGDRHRIAPWGIHGARDGMANRWSVKRDGEVTELAVAFELKSPSKFYNIPLRTGDCLIIETGGGGGYGNPTQRAAAAIRRDEEQGYCHADVRSLAVAAK